MDSALVLTQNDEIEKDGMFRLNETAYRTHHYDRSREMHLKDPVHTIDLLKYVDSQVRTSYYLNRFNGSFYVLREFFGIS